MVICEVCKIRMRRGHHEYYCPKCGLVKEDFILKPGYGEHNSKAVPFWRSGIKQTQDAFKWVNHRPVPVWRLGEKRNSE